MKNVSSAVTSALRTVRAARELNNQAPRAAGVTLRNINTHTNERCLTNNTGTNSQLSTEQNAAAPRAGKSTSFAADRTDLPLGTNTSGANQRLKPKSKILRLLATYGNPRAKSQGAQKGAQIAASGKNGQPSPRPDIPDPIHGPLNYAYLDALHDSLSELEGESNTDTEDPYLLPDDGQAATNQPLYMNEASAPTNPQPTYENQKSDPFASHIYETIDEMNTPPDSWKKLIGTFTDENGEEWGAYEEDSRVNVDPSGKITISLDFGVTKEVTPLQASEAETQASANEKSPEPPQELDVEKEPTQAQNTQEPEKKSKPSKPLQFEKQDDSLIDAIKQRRVAISGDSDSESDSDDEN